MAYYRVQALVFMLLASLLGIGTEAAFAKCIQGQEFQPRLCPVQFPAVRSVRVESTGITTSAHSLNDPDCASFRLTAAAFRKYLAEALEFEESQGHYTLSDSTCASQGVVVFANGATGTWQVGNLKEGWLQIRGQAIRHLYCATCNFKPFNN